MLQRFDAAALNNWDCMTLYNGSGEKPGAMPRVTLSVGDREHMALKLLALQRNVKMVAIIDMAIKEYLEREGGCDLSIRSRSD